MLRCVYVLICIHLCFCYEYFDENQLEQLRRGDGNGERRDDKLVQFDVLSFIKNSVTDAQDYDPYFLMNKKRDNRRTQSDDYYEAPIIENIKKRDENNDYFNIEDVEPKDDDSNDNDSNMNTPDKGINDPNKSFEENEEKYVSNREDNNKQAVQNKLLVDRNFLKDPEKKCAFKNMKVPFFSRKKSSTKKQNKNKLLCLNCAKTYTKDASKVDTNVKSKLQQKIKRAYGNLCPKCIKKLLKCHQKEEDKIRQVHNSREFYQSIGTSATTADLRQHKSAVDYDFPNDRVKRDGNEERERQLKELAVVERKVDNVKITTPKIAKVPSQAGRLNP